MYTKQYFWEVVFINKQQLKRLTIKRQMKQDSEMLLKCPDSENVFPTALAIDLL